MPVPTSFLTGLSTEVKPYIDGNQNDNRYPLVNSRNYNRKIIRSGNAVTTQKLGIEAPTVAPTGAAGTIYYCYVYVNKRFRDPYALEADNYIRSDASPVSTALAGATVITGTASTDTQVTHAWLYMASTAAGPFVRADVGYETDAATMTWTAPASVPVEGNVLEIDNGIIDTCRITSNINDFALYGGFVPISTTASVTIGSPTVTGTGFPDGIIGLNLQFDADTTGGIGNDGIHIANWVNSTTLQLVNLDGTPRNYDGPANKTNATVRIWRLSSVVQIAKRGNPDFTPGIIDPDFLIRGQGSLTGIARPPSGFAVRFHYNNNGKKAVIVGDFAQGVPPRLFQTASVYSMANPRAYASAGGRMFYYDFNAGVIEDRSSVHIPITLPVIPNLIKSLNRNSESLSEMVYDDSRNLLFLSVCPSGYTKAYYLIVYNLNVNTWNLWFMLPDVNAMGRIKDDTTGNILVMMGSSNGLYTLWPSDNFNEAVGTSIFGNVGTADDSTHLTATGTPFPTTGDKLKDRWVMTWNDLDDVPVYQFARISDNTDSRLTLDTFITPNSTVGWLPNPAVGDSYWIGPIQSILGPNWDYNSIPDDDGHVLDVSMTSSGLSTAMQSRVELYRNFETTPITGQSMIHNTYWDQTIDPDHQSVKFGANKTIESVGVTGWKVVDNNESPFSIKSLVRRIRAIHEKTK